MLSYRCHLQDVPSPGSFYTIQRTLIYKEKSLLKKGRRGVILENCLLFPKIFVIILQSHRWYLCKNTVGKRNGKNKTVKIVIIFGIFYFYFL